MRTVRCFNCSSDKVEYKSDIIVGCCKHKSGEVWHCDNCGEDMVIQTVYSEEPVDVDCPHQNGNDHKCGGCSDCGKNN